MKLVKLSEKILKSMVLKYKENGQDLFDFDFFKNLHPNESDESLSKSLQLLENDDLVSIWFADNIPYSTTLNPKGIANVEENTMIKKGYTLIKEIKNLM